MFASLQGLARYTSNFTAPTAALQDNTMAAVNLPDNPANGSTQTVGGIAYTYNSVKDTGQPLLPVEAVEAGAPVTTSDTAPSSPFGW